MDYLETKLADLELSYRTGNVLITNEGMVTIGDLMQRSEQELLRLANFGRKSLNEVKEVLGHRGFALKKMSPQDPIRTLSHLVGRVHATKYAYDSAVKELARYTKAMDFQTPPQE